MKYEKAFADLKKLILKADEKKLEGEFAFQFCIEGDAEGTFYAEFKNGVLSVEPYDYADNTATFKASYATFKELLAGKTAASDAVASGALKVEGNEAGCADIFTFISGKKTTAKKAAPVKAEAKAAAKAEAKAAAKAEAKPAAKKAPAKPAAKTEAKPAAKTEAKPAAKAAAKAEAKPAAKAAPKAETKEVKAAPAKAEAKPAVKAETKAAKGKPGRKKTK